MPGETRIVRTEGSRAVQGCLIGAVVLFVVLLGVMIVLGYQQFRENTGEPAPRAPGAVSTGPPGPAPLALAASFAVSVTVAADRSGVALPGVAPCAGPVCPALLSIGLAADPPAGSARRPLARNSSRPATARDA